MKVKLTKQYNFQLVKVSGACDQYVHLNSIRKTSHCNNPVMLFIFSRIMQRTVIIIMPLVLASFITGALSEYEQVSWLLMASLNGN